MRSRKIVVVLAAVALLVARAHAQTAPSLHDAASFVVLGHSRVVNSGKTSVTGNVGVSPSEIIEGLSDDMFVLGDMRRNDALARSARRDSDAADADLASRRCGTVLDATELGGRRFFRGVHCFTSTDVRLNGTVTLDAEGNRDAVWIFRFAGALTTGSGAQVLVVGNGYDGNAFWRSEGRVTVGAGARFIGNIFAGTGIAFEAGARMSGRALTRTGAVTLNGNLLLLCCAPITVSPPPVLVGTLGTRYEQKFSASGGRALYTFTTSSGSLPPGLVLASDGTLEGTPERTGRFAFTITATDEAGCTGSAEYLIEIEVDCGVSTELKPAILGVAYDKALFPAGTCTRIAGAFPDGLGLVPGGCKLEGLPREVGTFSFIVESTIGGEHCFTLRVEDYCPIVIADAPPAGVACSPYSHTFSASCAVAPVFTAEGLPVGIGLSSVGKLSGEVSSAGPYPFTVTVTDPLMRSHTQSFTLVFDCPPNPVEEILLPSGEVGVPYSEQLPNFTCGEAELFSPASALPPGFTGPSNDGVVSGMPTKSGSHRFAVAFTSRDGCTVVGTVRVDVCPDITLSDLPPMVQGVHYDQTIVIGGIEPPYVVTDAGLPEGIVREGLQIHGNPSLPGPYAFTITVTHPATSCVKSRTYSPNCPVLTIAPDVLPDGVEGVPYGPIAFSTSGGTEPYVYSISAGSPPAGVDLSGDTLSGTPTDSGPFSFTVQVTDKYGCTATREYSIFIACTTVCPEVPALSEWALWLFMMLMAGMGILTTRRS